MNHAHMKLLHDSLVKVHHDSLKFHIRHWSESESYSIINDLLTKGHIEPEQFCDTVACAFGWYVHLNPEMGLRFGRDGSLTIRFENPTPEQAVMDSDQVASEHFDLPIWAISGLFFGQGYSGDYDKITVDRILTRVDWLRLCMPSITKDSPMPSGSGFLVSQWWRQHEEEEKAVIHRRYTSQEADYMMHPDIHANLVAQGRA